MLRGSGFRTAAMLAPAASRDPLELVADQPGLQVYTGNGLDGTSRVGGVYRQGDGIALEPQLFPDSPNHPDGPRERRRPAPRRDLPRRPALDVHPHLTGHFEALSGGRPGTLGHSQGADRALGGTSGGRPGTLRHSQGGGF